MPGDIESEIAALKDAIREATARSARAQVERDAAAVALQGAREALLAEFGCQSPEQAREALSGLQAAQREALAQAVSLLEQNQN